MELTKWGWSSASRWWRALWWQAALGACFAAGARGEVIITELMYDPASTNDGSWEYIEVMNLGTATVDLSAFVLDDESGNPLTVPNVGSANLGPGQVAVLYNDATADVDLDAAWLSTGAPAGHAIRWIPVSPWPGLTNTGEHLGLWPDLTSYGQRDFSSADDELTYADVAPWPVPDGAGSIYLTDPLLSGQLGDDWGLSEPGVGGSWSSNPAGLNAGVNVGSPGIAPSVVVPEPTAAVLASLATLFGWGASRRRLRYGHSPA